MFFSRYVNKFVSMFFNQLLFVLSFLQFWLSSIVTIYMELLCHEKANVSGIFKDRCWAYLVTNMFLLKLGITSQRVKSIYSPYFTCLEQEMWIPYLGYVIIIKALTWNCKYMIKYMIKKERKWAYMHIYKRIDFTIIVHHSIRIGLCACPLDMGRTKINFLI